MFRTGLRDNFVIRAFWGDRLQDFLELPFGIHLQRLMGEPLDILLGFIQHKAPDNFETAVQVHCADQRFERVGQNRGALSASTRFFTAAHHQEGAEPDVNGVNFQAFA